MTTDHPADITDIAPGIAHIAPAGTDPHDPTAWTEVGYAEHDGLTEPAEPAMPIARFELPAAVVLNLRGTFGRLADALTAFGRSLEALFGEPTRGFWARERRRQRRADPTRIRVSRMHAAYHRRTR